MDKAKAEDVIKIIENLIGIGEVSIILNTFISAFTEKSIPKADEMNYLHGSFNLGGTVSGRLSSSNPNLMNLPSSGTIYAKPIKQCFKAPDGWIMAGADFNSLEDMISALTTKDPEKIKVYTDKYDGHCLRAYTYFKDQMPNIKPTVKSINSIKDKYPELRQRSKEPTFLLTYGGTHYGLMYNAGFSEDEAKAIEKNYHQLYKHSDKYIADKINQATKDGYVTGAFGLRLRTPILSQTLLNKKSTPYESKSESRTAGNMLGQSYGMLNNRSAIEFMDRVHQSKYKYDILPICHIHDSQYYLIRDALGIVEWFNKNLIECMQWQQLPEIVHPDVHLGASVELYYPDWGTKITLPNNATRQEIYNLCKKE